MYRRLLRTTAISAGLSLLALVASAQPCPVNGITTDPAGSVNGQVPSKRNVFNWQYTAAQPEYNVNWFFTGQRPYLETPYNQPSNPNNDVGYLQGTPDTPQSGWELIKKDVGYTDGPNPTPTGTGIHNPYVIIYNKYTGILRVFWAIGDRNADYQFCSIEVGFGGSNYNTAGKTGLLNRVSGVGVALKDTPPGTNQVLTTMKPFSNQFGAWFVADFPMEYDPCTCLKQSTVTLKVKLISQAQVSLSGTSTGTLASINNGAGTGPKDPSFRSVLAGTASGATTLINSTSSAFNSPYSLANNLLGGGTKASVTSFAEALAKSNFLKDGLKALPYVGTVASLLSFFLGGGQDSGPQKVSVQPMAINLSTITSGTITYSSDYSGSRFSTPGSQIRTGYLEEYPNYNEILGVATLIRKPKFDVVEAGLDQLFPDQLPEEFGDYPYYGGSGGQAILCFA